MGNSKSYRIFLGGFFLLFLGVMQVGMAQQTDTTHTEKKLKLKENKVSQPYHSERSSHKYLMNESGSYGVPEPTKHYKPPFTGQESLDRAVAAYRKEIEEGKGGLLLQFLSKIAPFINNQFEFGVYQIYDLPIADRDNPFLYPQVGPNNDEKK